MKLVESVAFPLCKTIERLLGRRPSDKTGINVPRDINVVALVKGEERYIFLFNDAQKSETLRTLGRYASDSKLSFLVRRSRPKPKSPFDRKSRFSTRSKQRAVRVSSRWRSILRQ